MRFISEQLNKIDEFVELKTAVENGKFPLSVCGVAHIHKMIFLYSLMNLTKALYIVSDEGEMSRAAEDLSALGLKCCVFPFRDYNTRSEISHSKEYEQKRLGTLSKMLDGDFDVCIAPVSAAVSRTVPKSVLKKHCFSIHPGETVDIELLCDKLQKSGYTRQSETEAEGQYSVRGGIVDIFPPSSPVPFRIDFWGDEVDTIKTFDAQTQRSEKTVTSVKITPICECIYDAEELSLKLKKSIEGRVKQTDAYRQTVYGDIDKLSAGTPLAADRYLDLMYSEFTTLFDYFEGTVFVSEYSYCAEKLVSALSLMKEDFVSFLEDGIISKKAEPFILTKPKFANILANSKTVYFDNFTKSKYDTDIKGYITTNFKGTTPFNLSAQLISEEIPQDKNSLTVILAGAERAAKNLTTELNENGIDAIFCKEYKEIGEKGIFVTVGGLSSGFHSRDGSFCVITHGVNVKKHKPRFKKGADIGSLENLRRGDYVVHLQHGIGEFDGVQPITSHGVTRDYIKIKYLGKDVLYVPVTSLDMVSKYIGTKEDTQVKLNRLGSSQWKNARTRVRKAVKDIAKQLTALYAERIKAKGFAFSPDDEMQHDFEMRFKFDETEDQLRSADEIKRDMQKPYPMDRLLCGDVGFGKTEVALRAAFKCVADGKQCAILVPTTILAWQHFNTALDRFSGMPVNIEMISRFRTEKQQNKIKKDLACGAIDIIIGTHRLVSKDIEFKDLGLLIVDEEQRFGVGQKERLKELFPSVDVLTLSATPIPRTLNMALSGIRDMSSIEEAPSDRHPVQTYVLEQDNGVVAEAINKELRRGGQVFYLYNRVDSIERRALEIQKTVPDARVAVAHGKMGEDELSRVWKAMLEHSIDVLVCTTIIETGVDVPNANTLIIEDADRLGLSQLHQIRGRVGRSHRRAFAYLLFKRGKALSEISQKRLNAIKEFTEFGSGFKIAMRDLEIRGAGNILGGEQHGHMEAVGYSLYLQMLGEAVSEEKGETVQKEADCLIDIKINSHIPESYITSLPQRIAMYRRIASIKNDDDFYDVTDELIDRFGDIPQPVKELLQVALIRAKATALGVQEISERGYSIVLKFREFSPEFIQRFLNSFNDRVSFKEGEIATVSLKIPENTAPITTVKEAIDALTSKN